MEARFDPDTPPVAVEWAINFGMDDPRWTFYTKKLDDGHIWVIGSRVSLLFPMFRADPAWRFEDFSAAFKRFCESDDWTRFKYMVGCHSFDKPECP